MEHENVKFVRQIIRPSKFRICISNAHSTYSLMTVSAMVHCNSFVAGNMLSKLFPTTINMALTHDSHSLRNAKFSTSPRSCQVAIQ